MRIRIDLNTSKLIRDAFRASGAIVITKEKADLINKVGENTLFIELSIPVPRKNGNSSESKIIQTFYGAQFGAFEKAQETEAAIVDRLIFESEQYSDEEISDGVFISAEYQNKTYSVFIDKSALSNIREYVRKKYQESK